MPSGRQATGIPFIAINGLARCESMRSRLPAYQSGQVGPVSTTGARHRPARRGGDVGDAIASVVSGVGGLLGEEVERRIDQQAVANDTESRERTLLFQSDSGEILTKAKSARGLDAAPAYKAAEEQLLQLRAQSLRGASNQDARDLLTHRLDAYIVSYRSELMAHEATEVRTSMLEAYGAQARMATEQAVRNWVNPELAQQYMETGLAAVTDRADMMGREGLLLDQDRRDFVSSVHRQTFASLVADGDWDAALAYEGAYGDSLTADDATAISATLRTVKEGRESYGDVQWALGVGSPASDLPTGGAFKAPVAGATVTSSFAEQRGEGKSHNGVDWAAPEGSSVRPMAPGRVVRVSSDVRSGNYVVIEHGNGTTTSYSHLGRSDVQVGDEIDASTSLGTVGMTGNTTGPHVHVVARKHGKTVDPVTLLGRGASNKSWNRSSAEAAIDAQGGWSFERRQRAKERLGREISESDQVRARGEREADRKASEIALELGDGFVSLEQFGGLQEQMSIGALDRFSTAAKSNKIVGANSATYLMLSRVSQQNPDEFSELNLGEYIGQTTMSELRVLSDRQGSIIRDGPKAINFRAQIEGTITAFALPELRITGRHENKADRIRVHDSMASYLQELTAGKRSATPAELRDAFNVATQKMTVESPGFMWGTNSSESRVYDIGFSQIPEKERNLAKAALRKEGEDDSDDAVVALYLDKLARTEAESSLLPAGVGNR